ncbi:hypothetical protein M0R01_03575 [bacterium]|nr:hypothetical protein [bacterium]
MCNCNNCNNCNKKLRYAVAYIPTDSDGTLKVILKTNSLTEAAKAKNDHYISQPRGYIVYTDIRIIDLEKKKIISGNNNKGGVGHDD